MTPAELKQMKSSIREEMRQLRHGKFNDAAREEFYNLKQELDYLNSLKDSIFTNESSENPHYNDDFTGDDQEAEFEAFGVHPVKERK